MIGLADETASLVARQFNPTPVRSRDTPVSAIQRWSPPRPTLAESHERFLNTLERLDRRYKELEQPEAYPARYTFALSTMLNEQKQRAEKHQE
jgi:hypothetical protein